jgi:hypothetical protein
VTHTGTERAETHVVDLILEEQAERRFGFDEQIVLEQAVFAELAALARTAATKSRRFQPSR